MKYAIRIGFAALCAGFVTYTTFNLMERLLRVGAGQMAWGSVLSVTSVPATIYLEPHEGMQFDLALNDSTLLVIENPSVPVQANFKTGEIHWPGTNVSSTICVPNTSRAYLIDTPGSVTFYNMRRGRQGVPIRIAPLRGGHAQWHWVGNYGRYFLVVSPEEWLARAQAWHTQVPAKLEDVHISLQAGDYVFFEGEWESAGTWAREFQFGFRDARGKIQYYGNKNSYWMVPLTWGHLSSDEDMKVVTGYQMAVDCNLWVAYVRSGRAAGSRTALLKIYVLREVQ